MLSYLHNLTNLKNISMYILCLFPDLIFYLYIYFLKDHAFSASSYPASSPLVTTLEADCLVGEVGGGGEIVALGRLWMIFQNVSCITECSAAYQAE